jgi:hypothetical protein
MDRRKFIKVTVASGASLLIPSNVFSEEDIDKNKREFIEEIVMSRYWDLRRKQDEIKEGIIKLEYGLKFYDDYEYLNNILVRALKSPSIKIDIENGYGTAHLDIPLYSIRYSKKNKKDRIILTERIGFRTNRYNYDENTREWCSDSFDESDWRSTPGTPSPIACITDLICNTEEYFNSKEKKDITLLVNGSHPSIYLIKDHSDEIVKDYNSLLDKYETNLTELSKNVEELKIGAISTYLFRNGSRTGLPIYLFIKTLKNEDGKLVPGVQVEAKLRT